ncbi:hypothetical protein EHS25_005966 [Saitozyma podzolica]|uniref:Chitin-binding type-4 domain-containing protein n=1 Tax=Saitozyma podzolica TaxID=1890683 RepID=A0A427XTK8_9TREE|nr:hypothetical protein EHS25_005966 [Saitozyma podzolica]
MAFTRHILASLFAISGAMAHMQLQWPPALHSKFNSATPEEYIDYSMTSPLVTDGTFPCKGFINNPTSLMAPTVTWDAGSTINVTLTGTATHNGGSCQFALSYDNGTTWSTIYSYVGGCMIDTLNYDMQLPSESPSGTAIFAWMWENHSGNREMYMNCAVVDIANGGSGLDSTDYPAPFVANAGVNDCVTIEGIDVVYPNLGKNVQYGGSYASTKPATPAGFTGSNCVPPGQTSSSNSTSSNSSTTSFSAGVAASTSTSASTPSGSAGVGNNAAAVTPSSSTSATASATGTTCKRRKRSAEARSLKHDGMRRSPHSHDRLVRKSTTGRVAAMKAEHIAR